MRARLLSGNLTHCLRSRHGQLEDREPYRLKDRNGDPVLCHRCGTSALPPDLAAAGPATKRARRAASTPGAGQQTASGRSIISCDYCHLHWHLDCLDPPMTYMPPWNKRWMCLNHADQILVSLASLLAYLSASDSSIAAEKANTQEQQSSDRSHEAWSVQQRQR